ncbi:MAG: DUF3298 and DUF4163 domain-containing protein [Bacillota bacterium]|jgi:hypothetical protein
MVDTNYEAQITGRGYQRKFFYENSAVLMVSVLYVQVDLPNLTAQKLINERITMQVQEYFNYATHALYEQAVEAYIQAQQNGFPFHAYEAMLKYYVSYNENCHLSLFRDRYEYLGGAHGQTIRASDTWNLNSGNLLTLGNFFFPCTNYYNFLINEITKQAQQNIKEHPGIYFDDYRQRIKEYFDPQNYYLTPQGLAIYYQQYEIAPYATGIVVFTIPYEKLDLAVSCSH